MSSEDLGKFTSYGLTSIDIATSVVLKNLMVDQDFQTAYANLQLLAETPGDVEISEMCRAHAKETTRTLQHMRCETSLTIAERFSQQNQERDYLKERSYDLYWKLRRIMNTKGYLKWSALTGKNPNPKHIKDESGIT
jgi:hypothetical protein